MGPLTFTVASSSIYGFLLGISSVRFNFFVQKGKGILGPHIDTRSCFWRKIREDEPIFEEIVFQLGSDYPPTSCVRCETIQKGSENFKQKTRGKQGGVAENTICEDSPGARSLCDMDCYQML